MTASPPTPGHFWKWWHPVLLLLIIVAIVVVEERWLKSQPLKSLPVAQTQDAAQESQDPPEAAMADSNKDCDVEDTASPYETVNVKRTWILIMVLMVLFILVAGHGITGYWRGALIDNENKISLSRLQMAAWTVLIISAYMTAVLINIHRGQPNATDICLDETLWALMGITTTSLVGSPLLKGRKKGQPTTSGRESAPAREIPDDTQKLLSQQGVDVNKIKVEGVLVGNQSPNDASWMDLFKGETVEDAGHLDLSKIQMFFFTIITLLAYAVVIGSMFDSDKTGIVEFPTLSDGLVALLGISHAGYLASKAVSSPPPQ